MSASLLGECQFDDGWPSEKAWHRGETRWVVVIDEVPRAQWVDDEAGLQPESSLKWRRVEACERCAERLLAPSDKVQSIHRELMRGLKDVEKALQDAINGTAL